MPHKLTLKRETAKQYKLVRRAKVPASRARHKLQQAKKESISQIAELNSFFMKKRQTIGTITLRINHHLKPLLEAKESLSLPEAKNDPDNQLEIAAINIHIAGWNWLKARWLPRKSIKKDFSFSAVMGHHKKHL